MEFTLDAKNCHAIGFIFFAIGFECNQRVVKLLDATFIGIP